MRWLRLFLGCPHDHMIRETRDGVKVFACSQCGHSQPQIGRDEPLTVLAPAHERLRAVRQPAPVVRLRGQR